MPGVVELVGVTYSEASGESCQNRAGSRKKNVETPRAQAGIKVRQRRLEEEREGKIEESKRQS